MSLPNGRPMEGQVISRSFKRLIRKNNLPDVVFHSLRHSSTTYKLKLNGGDMKSMQGDTGHAQLKMVSDVYSHILDEDRRHNAEMFEDAFYKKTPTAQKKKNKHFYRCAAGHGAFERIAGSRFSALKNAADRKRRYAKCCMNPLAKNAPVSCC